MDKSVSSLTVLFDDPFWVGIYERQQGKNYEVSKIVFGAEPKDYDVYDFILKTRDLRFSKSKAMAEEQKSKINPKRMQREIKKQLQNTGIGTKAQQAMALQHEQNKLERKVITKEMREALKERKLELHRIKRREKHNGH